MNTIKRNHPALLLASLISGLLLTPVLYIAIGALGAFSIQLSYFILPPFILCAGFLFWRLFSSYGSANRLMIVLEAVSWAGVVFFLAILSGFRLFTLAERIGFASSIYIVAVLISYPVLRFRASVLLSRVEKLPETVSSLVVLTITGLTAVGSGYYLVSQSSFM